MPILSRPIALSRALGSKALNKPLVSIRALATVTDHTVSTFDSPATYAHVSSRPLPAALKMKSGQIFRGTSYGAPISVSGEAVFTTSLVGYPESMTDPSYRGQILTFTQPLIGNYGVPGLFRDKYGLLQYFESERIQVEGIIIGDYATKYSHWTAVESLGEWCARHKTPIISGVDTRAIVHVLREQGSTLARLDVGNEAMNDDIKNAEFSDPNIRNLVAEVSTGVPLAYNPFGDIKIAVIDCGVKQNIIRSLVERGAAVTVLPWNFDFAKVADQFDGLFISNGPGNPTKAMETVVNLRASLDVFHRPIFGICMGNLLLGMASGLDVYKLQFGNRGHNVPAVDLNSGRCSITSQNHGYALKDDVMPSGWKKFFVNANDGSNEGVQHITRPVRSVQFHPEAKGGPEDTRYLFDEFLHQVRADKTKRDGVKIFVTDSVSHIQPTPSVQA